LVLAQWAKVSLERDVSKVIGPIGGRRRIHAKIYQSARMFKIFVLKMLKNCRKSDYNVSFMHFFCGFLSFFIAFELAWEAAP
jgi:hypothetical protein